jgi:hypothetical protein
MQKTTLQSTAGLAQNILAFSIGIGTFLYQSSYMLQSVPKCFSLWRAHLTSSLKMHRSKASEQTMPAFVQHK